MSCMASYPSSFLVHVDLGQSVKPSMLGRCLVPALKTNWLVAFLILLSTFSSNAHTLPISDLILVADEDYLHLELSLNPSELNFPSDFAASKDDAKEEIIARIILDHISVAVGTKCLVAETAGIVRSGESHHLELRAHYPLAATSGILQIESLLCDLMGASHFTQVTFRKGEEMRLAQLDNQRRTASFGTLGQNVKSSLEASSETRTKQPQSTLVFLPLLLLALLPMALLLLFTAFLFLAHQHLPRGMGEAAGHS